LVRSLFRCFIRHVPREFGISVVLSVVRSFVSFGRACRCSFVSYVGRGSLVLYVFRPLDVV